MKTKILCAALLLNLCLIFVGWTSQKPGWEYKEISTLKLTMPKEVHALGAEGWELFGVTADSPNDVVTRTTFYLRRQR